jgi:hypothetical protein
MQNGQKCPILPPKIFEIANLRSTAKDVGQSNRCSPSQPKMWDRAIDAPPVSKFFKIFTFADIAPRQRGRHSDFIKFFRVNKCGAKGDMSKGVFFTRKKYVVQGRCAEGVNRQKIVRHGGQRF